MIQSNIKMVVFEATVLFGTGRVTKVRFRVIAQVRKNARIPESKWIKIVSDYSPIDTYSYVKEVTWRLKSVKTLKANMTVNLINEKN